MNPFSTTHQILAAQAGDQRACEALIQENTGLIWSVVKRYIRDSIDREDLYQLGCLGFLKAIKGFDPAFGTQFSTYAVPKIAGEMRRFLRDDGLVKVGRGTKEQALTIYRARTALTSRLGREPVLSELSEATGLTPEDIAAADLAVSPVTSLQAESGDSGLTLEGILSSDSPEEGLVEHMALRTAIDHLPKREHTLILLRYYKGLTQAKTGKVLGISQVQVSRLEKKTLTMLRSALSEG